MKLRTVFIVAGILLTMNSFAWGVLGHRIVGEVAQSFLTSKAKKKIAAILGNESIALASNWPDFIKYDPSYSYLSPWHYVNISGGLSAQDFATQLEKDTSVNAYNKIIFLKRELKNNLLDTKLKSEYLKLLIHLVGDIHQPLHVGRAEDRGGNSIKLTWFGDAINLHQVWDERLINFQQLSYTEYTRAINFSSADQRKTWQKESLTQWFYQSYQMAERIYGDITPDEKLGYNYNFKYISIVNTQLLKGGVRLAGVLNEVFK